MNVEIQTIILSFYGSTEERFIHVLFTLMKIRKKMFATEFILIGVLHNIFIIALLWSPKTEVRTLFHEFFTANILFWEDLGVVCFRPKNQSFL